ncbi:helix-turn-helix domain-containing protein [Pseudonocardia ailaonensis]|uniref:helix-turn-helix domain-containing protein n=1 Tax=Pseudonocardia ailaonensis TaxID=367279 RepID=UPI003CD091F1
MNPPRTEEVGGLTVIAKVGLVLRTVGAAAGGATTSEVAREASLPRPTTHRLLGELTDRASSTATTADGTSAPNCSFSARSPRPATTSPTTPATSSPTSQNNPARAPSSTCCATGRRSVSPGAKAASRCAHTSSTKASAFPSASPRQTSRSWPTGQVRWRGV